MKTMIFLPFKKKVTFTGLPSLLEVAIANEVPLNHSCGGMASCTTCRVFIKKGLEKIPARNELEQEHATIRQFSPAERLACQTTAFDGLVVEIPKDD